MSEKEEIEREPCPHCGELAALAGRICPHCKGSLLVDVILDTAPPDPRARYQLARGLASLDSPPLTFLAAKEALDHSPSLLASSVTRDMGRRLLDLTREHGGRGHTVNKEEAQAAPAASRNSRVRYALALACLLAVAGLAVYAWRSRPATLTTAEVAARATPATVMLRCSHSTGSGFFVRDDLVLTSAHVLCGPGDPLVAILSTHREVEARVFQRDDWLDLALVRVPGVQLTPLPLGDATALHAGDPVIFIGTPQGLEFTVTEGIVSHKARNVMGISYVQINANVNPGNSGGPLLDHQGRVVGIVSAKLDQSEGLGFALPVNYAYADEPALLAPPASPAPGKAAWKKLMDRIAEEERQELSQMRSVGAVVGTQWVLSNDQFGAQKVEIELARIASAEPGPVWIKMSVRSNGSIVCRQDTISSGWQQIGTELARQDPEWASSRYFQWLRKNGLEKDLFKGSVTFDFRGCPLLPERPGKKEILLETLWGRRLGSIEMPQAFDKPPGPPSSSYR